MPCLIKVSFLATQYFYEGSVLNVNLESWSHKNVPFAHLSLNKYKIFLHLNTTQIDFAYSTKWQPCRKDCVVFLHWRSWCFQRAVFVTKTFDESDSNTITKQLTHASLFLARAVFSDLKSDSRVHMHSECTEEVQLVFVRLSHISSLRFLGKTDFECNRKT